MDGGANARRRQDAGADGASGNGLGHFSGADEAEIVGIGGNRNDFHFFGYVAEKSISISGSVDVVVGYVVEESVEK